MICISEGSKSSSIQSFGTWSCMDWIYGHLDALLFRASRDKHIKHHFTTKIRWQMDLGWMAFIAVTFKTLSKCHHLPVVPDAILAAGSFNKGGSFWVVFLGWLLFLGHFLDERFSPHIFERTKQPSTQRVGFWIGECFPRNIPNFLPEFSSRLRPVFGTWKTPQQFQTCERQEM